MSHLSQAKTTLEAASSYAGPVIIVHERYAHAAWNPARTGP